MKLVYDNTNATVQTKKVKDDWDSNNEPEYLWMNIRLMKSQNELHNTYWIIHRLHIITKIDFHKLDDQMSPCQILQETCVIV